MGTPEDILLRKSERMVVLKKTIITSLDDLNHDATKLLDLEIGCGHGHWLTSFAEQDQNRNFIGIDLITKRIEKARNKASKRLLPNVSFLKADALEFLHALPQTALLQDCFVMYPDPWPKNRHHKKRLINLDFLDLLFKKSTNSSKLYFMTDHTEYFVWSKSLILQSKYWNLTTEEWPHIETSYFQDLLPKNNFLVAIRQK